MECEYLSLEFGSRVCTTIFLTLFFSKPLSNAFLLVLLEKKRGVLHHHNMRTLDITVHLQVRALLAQTDQVFVRGKTPLFTDPVVRNFCCYSCTRNMCWIVCFDSPLMNVTLVMSGLHGHASKNWNSSQSPGSETTEIKMAFQ